jgi:imidazolonepropionase-like amidohydrolase
VIDAKGCTVIPGLMNLHSHPQRRHARFLQGSAALFRGGLSKVEELPNTQRILMALKNAWVELLEDGVTTQRDAGSKDYTIVELRDALRDGIFKGPRILSAGPILAMTGGHGTRGMDSGFETDGPDEMGKVVRKNLKAGVDWIKLCVSGGGAGIHMGDHPSIVEYSEEEIRVAVVEAHNRKKRVMVHSMAAESTKRAVRAGVDCIEHGKLLDTEAIHMMRDKGVFFVPTMTASINTIRKEREAGNKKIADMMEELNRPHRWVVSKCFESGVLIGTGSDTLGQILQEMENFVDCGMTRADALIAATLNSARVLGLERDLGSVEEGKIADLVVLEGNPLEDLAALRKIKLVILGGEPVTWEMLSNAKRNGQGDEKEDALDLGMSRTLREYAVNISEVAKGLQVK